MLQDDDRRRFMPPDRVVLLSGARAGETVVDLGAGTGFLTQSLIEAVGPAGRVIAVDVEPVMLDEIRTLVDRRDLRGVDIVLAEESSVPLPSATADLIVILCVLHEPPEPMPFLREVVRLLKPEGRVLVIDWHDRPTDGGPPLEYRVSEEEAVALLGAAGLTVERLEPPNGDVYALLAREFQPGSPEATAPTV